MMRTMRENTKVIMLITALAFVALMVFEWGMDLSGRTSAQASGGEIGRVNGESISYEEFRRVYSAHYDQQSQFMDRPMTTAEIREIENAAWEQVVLDRLVNQEVKRRGLEATDAEVRQAARLAPPPEFFTNPLFQTDGQFDPRSTSSSWLLGDLTLLLQLEAYYRQLIPRTSSLVRSWRVPTLRRGAVGALARPERARPGPLPAIEPSAVVPAGSSGDGRRGQRSTARTRKNSASGARSGAARRAGQGAHRRGHRRGRDRALALRREILAGADFAGSPDVSRPTRLGRRGGDLGPSAGRHDAGVRAGRLVAPAPRVSERS